MVEGTHRNEMLDIPEEYQSWQKYHGSAGHLINHGQEENVDYTECWHPRFGRILCVQTLKNLTPDTELLVKVRFRFVFPIILTAILFSV